MTETKNSQGQNNTPEEILKAILASKNTLVLMDSRFDFDSLCSVLAFSDFLIQRKLKHKCIYGYTILPKAKSLFDTSRIEENVNYKTFDYKPYDLCIFLDSGNVGHLVKDQDYKPPEGIISINIDHHAGNPFYGTLNYVQNLSSVGSVLFNLFKVWNVKITKEIANYLLASIITDTGLLQYQTVNQIELKKIIELMDLGGEYGKIIRHLTQEETYIDMVVKGLIYSNLVVDYDNKFAYSVLRKEELKAKGVTEFGVVPSDLIKKLEGVDFVFVIKLDPEFPDEYHISLRSHNPNYNVLRIAEKLGGGGHTVAAAGKILAGQAKSIEDVVKIVSGFAKELKSTS